MRNSRDIWVSYKSLRCQAINCWKYTSGNFLRKTRAKDMEIIVELYHFHNKFLDNKHILQSNIAQKAISTFSCNSSIQRANHQGFIRSECNSSEQSNLKTMHYARQFWLFLYLFIEIRSILFVWHIYSVEHVTKDTIQLFIIPAKKS